MAYLNLQGVVSCFANVELLLQLLRLLWDFQFIHQVGIAALVSNGVDTCRQWYSLEILPLLNTMMRCLEDTAVFCLRIVLTFAA